VNLGELLVLALALGLLAVTGNVHAVTYNWTNATSSGYLTDPGNWSAPGGPGGPNDTFTYLRTGTNTVSLTNNFANIGSFQFGAGSAGQNLVLTLNFGTNTFAGLSGNNINISGFVFGQTGTTVVYIAVGTMYCTNSFSTPSNARLIIGRSSGAPATVFLTNGTVNSGNLILANNATAIPSQLVISGAGSYWSNNNTVAIGNIASANFNSLVISNSGSMTVLNALSAGLQSTSHSNSLLVDTSGQLFTRGANATFGAGGGSVGNKATVQGGGLWDNGNRGITLGAGGGSGNTLMVGNNGTVTNVTIVAIFAGNSLSLSGGVLFASIAVTNTSGTVSGFGTIAGNVVFAGTGTLTPGFGATVGTLNHSTNLTLVSGSTTTMKLDKGQAGSNDLLNVVGTLTEAGTVTINNVGAALVGGDTFQLFTFGSESGDFAVTNLPSLNGSLVWNTSQLGPQGIISVVLPPGIIGPGDQATNVGATVTISTIVTGVPVPGVQWQLGGTNLVDDPTGNGSTISGSTSSALTILNAQVADSGSYCLIASNFASTVTNCMTLTISVADAAPTITGPTDQYTILDSNATFSASVAGLPSPTVQWQENGTNIAGATSTSVTLTNVQFTQDGFVYSIIASNRAGALTNSAVLHVVVPPAILIQPQNLTVTNTQSASFSVTYTNAVPPPTYQWEKNNVAIANATNATYTIVSAAPSDMANYSVVLANVAGSITSSNATLTVDSTMSAVLTPTNGATGVCYDTPLYMIFDRAPVLSGAGRITIYNATNTATPVDTIDTSLGNLQPRTIGTESFKTYPVIITNNTVTIYPHLRLLSYNQTYYVTVDPATFTDTNGALYAGITDTTAWTFATKLTGPANPNNIVVAADGSGDFCTVQGAVDSLPGTNTTYTLVNIRDGTYTEIVDTRNRNHITFRGQSRTGTIVGYANNNNINSGTHSRMAFKVYANDLAIENMTVVNTTPQGGSQAEALMIETGAARFILNNAEVDSRQDTILANVNSSQGYFYNSLVQGNYDYVWGGGNLFFTNCEIRTIPTASSYNLTAARTDNGPTGNWPGFGGLLVSNGISFVNCLLTRADNTITNVTLADANGSLNGLSAWIDCSIDTNCYRTPSGAVLASQLLWEYGNSNVDNTAAVTFGLTVLTNGDARLLAAGNAAIWLNGWVPQLAPNILTNPVSVTVTAGVTAVFSVSATGVPDPSYQWIKDGTNLVGATSVTLTITNAQDGDAGLYSVVVSNSAGSVTSGSATLTIIDLPPVADFSGAPTTGPTPLAVTFTDTSTGIITNRFWDFGDGNTTNTTATALGHSYTIGGTNTVSLTVFGPQGSSNQTRTAYIVAIDTLVADFSASPTTGVAPLLVHFTDNSAGTITNRFWDFGDGSTTNTTATSVDYTYTQAGTNTVNLTIFGPSGSSATNQPSYIVVTPQDTTPPQLHIVSPTDYQAFTNANITASGTASDASGLNGVTVNGVAASLAGMNWSQPVTLSLGTNTIAVIAMDASANLNTTTQVVHAVLSPGSTPTNHPPQITVGLSVTNTLLQVGSNAVIVADETNTLTVTATDADNDPLAYQWVFGDGANTNTMIGIVNHVYTNDCGPYNASVTVSDGQASTNSDLTVVVACQMQITRMRANLNFRKAFADSCSLTADIGLPNGFSPAGKLVTLDIGGAQSSFTLDAKNKAVNTQGRCAFKFNKKDGNWTITAKLARSNLQGAWADDGLVNADVPKPGNPVTLSVTVLVSDEAFVADETLFYTAKAGRSGAAR
jgi:PKD repeat protein